MLQNLHGIGSGSKINTFLFYLQIVASETLALGSSEKKLSTVLNLRVNSYYPLIQLLAFLVNKKLEEEGMDLSL